MKQTITNNGTVIQLKSRFEATVQGGRRLAIDAQGGREYPGALSHIK